MATTNAITQFLVPPPKYDVRRLVPSARVVESARLAAMAVIERGPDSQEWLNWDEAVDVLLANSDDAFGFPPYSTIKSFLYGSPLGDLRPMERATVGAALEGLPATVLRSSTRDWWSRLPSLLDRDRPNSLTREAFVAKPAGGLAGAPAFLSSD